MKAAVRIKMALPTLLLSLVLLLAMTSDAQLSNVPSKFMRARVGAIAGRRSGIMNVDRERQPTSSSWSSRRRRMKADDRGQGRGGGMRQFMSMDTSSTATESTTTTSITTSTTSTTTMSTSDQTDRQVNDDDDGIQLPTVDVSSLTSSPTSSEEPSSGTPPSTTTSSPMKMMASFMPSSSPILSVTTTSTSSTTAATTTTAASTSNDVSDGSSVSTITTSPTTTITQSPSTTRHGPIQNTGLTISLVGMTSIPNRRLWESTTSNYYMNVYNNNNDNNGNGGDGDEPNSGITNTKVQVSITNISIVPSSSDINTSTGGRRRRLKAIIMEERMLQSDMSVQVTYTQTMWYNTIAEDMEDASSNKNATATTTLLKYPLSTHAYRDEYVGQLKHLLNGYEDLTAVSAISIRDNDTEEAEQYAESVDGNLSVGAVIAMAAGGAALLTILGIIVYVHCKECRSKEEAVMEYDENEEEEYGSSTNHHRQYRNSTTTGGQTLDGGCSTVDYDYQRPGVYGKGGGGVSGLSYISDAGGTLGSRRSRRTGAAEHQEDDRTAMGNQTIFSDDPTYIQPRYDTDGDIDDNDDDIRMNTMGRDEMFEVFAPSGKLGVVIDNPDGRNPTIHAVKDTSPIATQVCVGDRVVAVDDEDVRGMSAMRVSRLISRKSGNVSRKLTIIRHVHC